MRYKVDKKKIWDELQRDLPWLAEFMLQWTDSAYINLDTCELTEGGKFAKVEIFKTGDRNE